MFICIHHAFAQLVNISSGVLRATFIFFRTIQASFISGMLPTQLGQLSALQILYLLSLLSRKRS